jgi:hypothetical protein
MPNNNPGDNRLGWSVNAGNNSGGLQRGIFGAALNALGQARRTEQRLHEFDYKESAKRETYLHRKAADIATKKIHGDNEYDTAKKAYDEFGGSSDNTTGFKFGTLNISRETDAMRERVKNATKSAETDAEKEARIAREKAEAKAQGSTTTGGTKKDRSNAATAKAAKAETNDGWAATAPKQTPTPSRTTSNITPPAGNAAPRVRKPRAPRAPKNPGQPGGMQ